MSKRDRGPQAWCMFEHMKSDGFTPYEKAAAMDLFCHLVMEGRLPKDEAELTKLIGRGATRKDWLRVRKRMLELFGPDWTGTPKLSRYLRLTDPAATELH